ncbi:hypothetical protein DJ017_09970 [Phenylobacterium soli]|uniref:SPOR domain-containing protein n=1 Tax=Phenylobacterium soli TaxID=2170551 RepID=A0A328AJZ8_9CAUL|nr:hypothetical protein DJ017_09970 [Phenylobacterium soli]
MAPGPHAYWYVPKTPVSYVKIGVAVWQPAARPRGLRAWIARHFAHRTAAGGELRAVAAASLGLPVPSRVEVTNLTTGAVITVRVDDKAPMRDGVIRLSQDAAQGLGAAPGKPLLVRVRYIAPVMAYGGRAPLRQAMRGPLTPTAPPPVMAAARPTVPPPTIVRIANAHPVPAASVLPRDGALALRPAQEVPRLQTGSIVVQAGAFASLANARRAVDLLKAAGAATIAPLRRGAVVLYRVVLPASGGAANAERLRRQVAEIGFKDARLTSSL